jgi:hypothetical protein
MGYMALVNFEISGIAAGERQTVIEADLFEGTQRTAFVKIEVQEPLAGQPEGAACRNQIVAIQPMS